jgi:glycosyltransferase involved in cell wall biosynthesis
MDNRPMVTVAIPVYNVERFLPKGFDSILAQTYTDFEIVVADDGSTDNTLALCEQIATTDPRIRVVHFPHRGIGPVRNSLIEQARGKYLFFFDIDDYIEPDLLADNVAAMEEGGNDMIFFGFYAEHLATGIRDTLRLPDRTMVTNEEFRQFYCDELVMSPYGCGHMCTKFYRMSFLRKLFDAGVLFEDVEMHEDELLNLQAFKHISKSQSLSKIYYHYVFYPKGNTSTRYKKNDIEDSLHLYHSRMELYRDWIKTREDVVENYRKLLLIAIGSSIMSHDYYSQAKMGWVETYKQIKQVLGTPEVRTCAQCCRIELSGPHKSVFNKMMDKTFYENKPLQFLIVRWIRDNYRIVKRRGHNSTQRN